MKKLLLTMGLAFAVASWAQSEDPDDEADTAEAAEQAEEESAEEADDSELDEQGYQDRDDDFRPSEEIPADESIAFPTDI